jgi:ABC-type transporter Mla subunit MlaD
MVSSSGCQNPLHALITVQVTQGGFGDFHQDATCQSRPQSLIGEYFLNCDPGHNGAMLAPGATIPVTHTTSTVPGDLLQEVMRLPYRQRLTLILNELGAAVAGNANNLQAALQRAVPALTETDNLLNLLANDSHTLQNLTATSNSLVTALANSSRDVQNFIVQSNNIATETASQRVALKGTFHDLPGFLEQLRPALQKLGAAADANTPALTNLNDSAGQIDRLLVDLPPFAHSTQPALKSLGQASVTGRAAVIAARPTVAHLNQFAKPAPELAQNLAIVLHDLDDRSRAVEADARSPGGKGFTGLESILQYIFNQVLAVDYFGPFGHWLALDLNISAMCTPYATPGTIAAQIKMYGAAYRQCYTWTGPSQPGVNETDPSNPSACVPDPGGAPLGQLGPTTSACKLSATARRTTLVNTTLKPAHTSATGGGGATSRIPSNAPGGSSAGGGGSGPALDLHQTITSLLGALGASTATPATTQKVGTVIHGQQASSSGGAQPLNQAQQLLSYLLSP